MTPEASLERHHFVQQEIEGLLGGRLIGPLSGRDSKLLGKLLAEETHYLSSPSSQQALRES